MRDSRRAAPLVLFNPRAGTAKGRVASDDIATVFSAAGSEAEVIRLDGSPVERLLAEHDPQSRRFVVAAGGDGTVRSVAEAVVDADRPLGVIPLGTRNHFARDVGIPLPLDRAVDALLGSADTPVDTGKVGGKLFLNNASLGLYPVFVEERRRRARVSQRWAAIGGAAWWVLAQRRRLHLRIDDSPETRASIVFVGNNPYELEGLGLGRRASLDRGELMLVLAAPTGPWSAARLVLRALSGRLTQEKGYRSTTIREMWIDTRRTSVRVALDGEPQRFRPPLHFRIRPASLVLRGASSA